MTTSPAAPELVSQSVSGVTSTAATFEAFVNANNEETNVSFEYATNEALSENEVTVTDATPLSASFGEQFAFAPTEPLARAPIYFYRVSASNAAGTTVDATVAHFLTGPPEAPKIEPATEETTESAKLHGVLNPNREGTPGTFEFLYRQSASKCQGEGEGKTTPQEAITGAQGQAVEAAVSSLLPGTTYTFCLLARNEAGETSVGNAVSFTTTALAPSIAGEPQGGETVSSLEAVNQTASSADLDAQIVPGGAAKYRFEYDTTAYGVGEAPHGSSTPEATVLPAGTSTTPVAVSQHLTGLSENTTYHWRLILENTAGKTESVDHTFVYDTAGAGSTGCPDEAARQARGSLSLPDCRAYEMVTPPEKNGALIGRPLIGLEPMISNDGSRIISSTLQCFAEPRIVYRRSPGAGFTA